MGTCASFAPCEEWRFHRVPPLIRYSCPDSFGRVVPNGVVGPEADPLRDGAVLLLGLGQLLLGAEGLVGLCTTC